MVNILTFAWYTLPTVYDQQKLQELLQVSAHTIRRYLRDVGLRCHRPYRGQPLVPRHRLARRRWAIAHARWCLNRWDSVIFFWRDQNNSRLKWPQCVYRRLGERFRDNCVVEEERGGRASTLIWAGIIANDRTGLVFLDQGVRRGGSRRRIECSTIHQYDTLRIDIYEWLCFGILFWFLPLLSLHYCDEKCDLGISP
jgi:hypothetical protein